MRSPAAKRALRPASPPPPARRKRQAVSEYRVEVAPPGEENAAAAQAILTWLAARAKPR